MPQHWLTQAFAIAGAGFVVTAACLLLWNCIGRYVTSVASPTHPISFEAGAVDLLLDKAKVQQIVSSDLQPRLMAILPASISPSSVKLGTVEGINLLEAVDVWGGDKMVNPRAISLKPRWVLSPAFHQFQLDYSDALGKRHRIESAIDLVYREDFEAPTSLSNPRLWHKNSLVSVISHEGMRVARLSPQAGDYAVMAFQAPHTLVVSVDFDFVPRTQTPNLEVGFSEMSSVIIGDSVLNEVKFKYKRQREDRSLATHTERRRIPPLSIGASYAVSIRRINSEIQVSVRDKKGAQPTVSRFRAKNPIATERHKYVSFWVRSNMHRALGSVPAEILLDNVRISFMPDRI